MAITWKLGRLDDGTVVELPALDSILGFACGSRRIIDRPIENIPAGLTVERVRFTVRKAQRAGATEIFSLDGTIVDDGAGGTAQARISLHEFYTMRLNRRYYFAAVARLSDESDFVVGYGPIQGKDTAAANPVAAAVVSTNVDEINLAGIGDFFDLIVTVTDEAGVYMDFVGVTVALSDPTKGTLDKSLLTTASGTGQATVRVTRTALGDFDVILGLSEAAYRIPVQTPTVIPVLAVRWSDETPINVPADAANILRTVRTYTDLAATQEAVGRSVSVNDPNSAVMTRNPASGVSPLAVTLDPQAAGGPINFVAASEGVTRNLAATVTAPGPTYHLNATFTAADSPNTVPNADTGQVFQQLRATWGIYSNGLYLNTADPGALENAAGYNAGVSLNGKTLDFYVADSGNGPGEWHPLFRGVDASNFLYSNVAAGGLYKVSADVWSSIGSYTGFNPSPGDIVRFVIVADGSSVEVFHLPGGVNPVSKGSVNIAGHHAAGQIVGMQASDASALNNNRMDRITVAS